MDENEGERRPLLQRLVDLAEGVHDEESFENARLAFEEALAEEEDAELMVRYGYLFQCRGQVLIREAISRYERAIELDPTYEKAHHQFILTSAMGLQHREAIDRYKQRLAAAPESLAEYRFLAQAYMQVGESEEAAKVIEAGLALEKEDPLLLEMWGGVLEQRGEPDQALALWERVLDLDLEHISARYSRVFLLQRLGRLEDAAAEWEAIIAWLLEHDYTTQTEWPKRELATLHARISASATNAEDDSS